MKVFQKVMNRIKQSTGLYKLASYWTAADTVEFNDGQTLEQCKSSFENAINNKGDTLYYDSETHMLYLLSGEDRLSGVEILSSGQGEVLGNVTNISAEASEKDVLIKWTDPEDGENIEWQGTIVMRKPNSRPVDCMDGTLIVDSTTRNQYQTEGYLDENLSSNTNYYYRFFPYSTEGQIRTGSAILVKTEVDETYIEEYPTIKGTYTYTGQTQNVQFDNFNTEKMEVTSGGSGVNADTYTVVVSPKEGFKWPDGSTTGIGLTWTINKAIISVVPSQSGTVTYTGSSRTPTWTNYDANKFDISGNTSGTNAGTYTVAFTPKSNYQWDDGTSVSKEVTWSIQKALINNTPVQSGTLSYDGSTKTPSWSYYNTSQLTIGGQTSGTDVGTYTAVFTPTSNYQWNDYTTTGKEIQWSIVETRIAIPNQNGTLTYDGTSKTPVWDNYDEDIMTKTETAQTNAGTYSTIFSLETGYAWSDGTTTDKTINWTIARAIITIPSATSTLKYNGNSQSPTWNSYYDTNKMTLGGTTSGIDAGTYSATFTPTSNYQWEDSSINSKTVTWSINKADGTLTLSKQSITFSALNATDTVIASDFNGALSASTSLSSVATVSVDQASGYITITCQGNGNANITVSVASSTNYTAVSKTISVSASIPQTISNVPTQKNTLTYNASSQTPTWNYYNTSQLTLSGTTSGTNAGSYTAKFTPKSGYVWGDGTNTTKDVTWTIGKATGSVTLSKNSVSLTASQPSDTVTYSNATGTVTATSNNTSIATVSTNNSIITITGVANGTTTISVAVGESTNYTAISKTISVKSLKKKNKISIPTQTNEVVYDTDSHYYLQAFSNLDTSLYDISGSTRGQDAGTYSLTFSLYDTSTNEWADGTTTDKTVNWVISKADLSGTLYLFDEYNYRDVTIRGVPGHVGSASLWLATTDSKHAYSGTNEIKDFVNNIQYTISLSSTQYMRVYRGSNSYWNYDASLPHGTTNVPITISVTVPTTQNYKAMSLTVNTYIKE